METSFIQSSAPRYSVRDFSMWLTVSSVSAIARLRNVSTSCSIRWSGGHRAILRREKEREKERESERETERETERERQRERHRERHRDRDRNRDRDRDR